MLETIKQTIKTLINFRTAALLTVTSIPAVTIAAARGNRYALEAISYIPGGPQALKFIINNKILEGLAAVASVATASLGYYAFKQYLDARSYIRRYKNGEIKGPSLISDAARSPVAALHTHVDRIHKSLGDTVTFFTDRDRTLDVVSLGQFGHLVKTTVANDPMQIVLLHAEDADTLARAFGFPHDSSRAGGRVEIIPFNISDVNDPDRALEDVLAGFRRLRFEPKLDNNAKVEVIDGVKYIRNQYFCAVIEKTGINDGEKSEDGYSVKIYVKNPPGKNLMAIPETGETQGLVEEVVLKKSLGLLDTPDDTIPVNFVRGWLADYTQLQREIASGLSKESALARVTSLAQAVGKDALHSVKDTADDMTRASALVDLAFKLATGNLPDFAGKAARGFIGRIIKRYVDSNTGAVRADEFTLKAGTVISRIAKPFAGPTGLTLEAHPSELQKAIEDRTLVVSSMATLVPAAKRVAGHTDFTSHINNGSIPILVDRRVIDYIRNGVGTPTAGTVSITGSTGNTVAHTTRTGGYTQATFRLQDGRDVSVMVNPLGSNAFHWMPDEQDSERRAKRSAAAGRESPEFMEQLYNCVLKLQGANAVQQGWLDSFTTEMQEQSKPVERKISLSPALKQVNRNDKKYVVPAPTGIRLFFATITGSRTGEGLNEALFKRDVAQAREKYQKALNRYNDTFKAADDAWIKKVLADPQHPYRSAVSQNSDGTYSVDVAKFTNSDDLPPSRHAANVETFNAILKALIENPACSIQNIEKRMHGTYIGLASATGSDGSANFESAENRAKRSGIFSAALDSINNKENKLVTVMIGDTVYVCKGTDKITLSNGQTISLYDFATNKTSGGTMAVPDSDFESVIKQKAVAVIVETEADRIKLLNPTPAAPTAGAGAAIASPAPRAA